MAVHCLNRPPVIELCFHRLFLWLDFHEVIHSLAPQHQVYRKLELQWEIEYSKDFIFGRSNRGKELIHVRPCKLTVHSGNNLLISRAISWQWIARIVKQKISSFSCIALFLVHRINWNFRWWTNRQRNISLCIGFAYRTGRCGISNCEKEQYFLRLKNDEVWWKRTENVQQCNVVKLTVHASITDSFNRLSRWQSIA